jgi:plastocyanin
MPSLKSVISVAGLVALSQAAVHEIKLTQSFKFEPATLEDAAEGDIIEFVWDAAGKHTVVAGDYDTPCEPLAEGGFFSGANAETVSSHRPIQLAPTSKVKDPC